MNTRQRETRHLGILPSVFVYVQNKRLAQGIFPHLDLHPLEPIPEPVTIALLGGGAAMLGAYLRRRRGEGEEE